jgi:peptidoglycan hydrolase-like protein with peptidoglycan-binding domain
MDSAKRVQLQQDLHWTGVYKVKVDGSFGQATYAAIGAYQHRLNLEPTGKLSTEELARLSSEASRIKELVRHYVSITKKPIARPAATLARKKATLRTRAHQAYAPRPVVVREAYVQPRALRVGPALSWILILP